MQIISQHLKKKKEYDYDTGEYEHFIINMSFFDSIDLFLNKIKFVKLEWMIRVNMDETSKTYLYGNLNLYRQFVKDTEPSLIPKASQFVSRGLSWFHIRNDLNDLIGYITDWNYLSTLLDLETKGLYRDITKIIKKQNYSATFDTLISYISYYDVNGIIFMLTKFTKQFDYEYWIKKNYNYEYLTKNNLKDYLQYNNIVYNDHEKKSQWLRDYIYQNNWISEFYIYQYPATKK